MCLYIEQNAFLFYLTKCLLFSRHTHDLFRFYCKRIHVQTTCAYIFLATGTSHSAVCYTTEQLVVLGHNCTKIRTCMVQSFKVHMN